MGTLLPLSENVSVKLNAFGDGTAKLGPTGHGTIWEPEVASVRVNGPVTNEATCQIFVGHDPTADNFVDATATGSTGDSTDNVGTRGAHMRTGNFIWAVWSHGDVGAIATLTVTGTVNLAGVGGF